MSVFRLPFISIGARKSRTRKPLALLVSILGVTLASASLGTVPAAAAEPEAAAATLPTTVSADPLPTVQIDGVAWAQAAVGNTVYVGGEFTNARPAGSAAGTNLTPRTNLLAYNLTTGALITSWNPDTNGRVLTMAVSPDGSRLYIGGTFTTVSGQSRYNAAAFDTSTGELTSWRPTTNGTVNSIAATASTVYLTGAFSTLNGETRLRIGAVTASSAALVTSFAPTLEGGYGGRAIVIAPDQSKIVVAGSFTSTNGSTTNDQGRGMASLDANSGALLEWKISTVLRNGGDFAAMYSLSSDGDSVYGTGYDYGGSRTIDDFEGAFRANWSDGAMQWMEDCHGDTYATQPLDGVIYTAAHTHYCGNVPGGFPQESPWYYNHSLAWSKDAPGTIITTDPMGYRNFAGNPAGKLLHWFPKWTPGTYTGANQAAWDVRASGNYLLYAGEFTNVAGAAQQGLVRFAKRTVAPNKIGPQIKGGNYKISVASFFAGSVRVAWQANHDPDSAELTYQLFRQGVTAPLYTTTASSTYWVRPSMMYLDTTVTAGQTYNYRVRATDSDGNTQQSDWTPVTVATTGSASAYNATVLADAPAEYWPMGEASGTTAFDWANGLDLTLASTGITRGATGPNLAQPNAATSFAGTSTATAASPSLIPGPQTFTIEAWFRTTSTAGGKIIGFGSSATGSSSSYDRQIYVSGTGAVTFGVYPGSARTITSATGFNDGNWHYVVGTLGSTGMAFYIDGKRIGTRADTTSAQAYNGYWRVGGDNLNGWPSIGSSFYLNGSISDVAVYNSVLSRDDVNERWVSSGRPSTMPPAPADNYGKAVYGLDPALYWRLGETSGTTAADAGKDGVTGTYFGGTRVTMGVPGALAGVVDSAVTLTPNGSATGLSSNRSFSNPTVYSLEAWFKTASTAGGKLVGFGSAQTGLSTNYDRHVYMSTSGQVKFGVYTGATQVLTSPGTYNNNAWHHVVATQSSAGMQLYLDGALVASNAVTTAQSYTGYWRVGGDNGWEGATWWTGTIDEVAVYSQALTSTQVQDHYSLGMAGRINASPTASFTATPTDLSVAYDASASSDPDGSIAQYAWDFGDGTTGTGTPATHSYAAGGTYTVKLTVTDNEGATAVSQQQVTVVAPNVPPVAGFTFTQGPNSGPAVAVDATSSTDPDGGTLTYAWTFGDGTSDTGVTASHTYAASGDYTIGLTVTDNRGGANSTSQTVHVVIPNSVPVPAFTFTKAGLTVSFDASGSTDGDNDPLTYSWAFGDSSNDSGKTVQHTYAATAETTYSVTLTVSDGKDSASTTQSVTVSPPPTEDVLAQDGFERTATGSWGTAQKGGTWTLSGGSAAFSVGGGQGQVTLAPGQTRSASLTGVSAAATVTDVKVAFGALSVGGVSSATVVGRQVGSAFYSVRVRLETTNKVRIQLIRMSGSEASLGTQFELADTYVPGTVVNVRLSVTGASPTSLAAKAWFDGSSEPSAWQREATDSTAALQAAGYVSIRSAVSSTSTVASTVLAYDNYKVTTGSAPTPNTPPVAAFSSQVDGLSVSVDGGGSSDADHDSLTYAWDFGDSSTGTGATASHTYAAAGTYPVKLTVSDGEDSDSVTHSVTVSAPTETVVAKDDFSRTVAAGGWGSADTGGAWTLSGGSAAFSVADGVGKVAVPIGGTREARLTGVSGTDATVEATVATDVVPTAGTTSVTVIARRVDTSYYGARVRFETGGVVRLYLLRDEVSLGSAVISGTYTPGTAIKVKVRVSGTTPTQLQAKAWFASDPEPSSWTKEASDSTAAMQAAGYLALRNSTSSASGSAVNVSFDALKATRIG